MKTNKNISRRSFVKKTSIMSSGVMISNQSIYEDLFLNKSDGPYFGNGCKNGWADQNSISIWSRLTKKPNANGKGEKFIDISKEDHNWNAIYKVSGSEGKSGMQDGNIAMATFKEPMSITIYDNNPIRRYE